MDKNAIKKYAVWARRELIERVAQRALLFGISKNDIGNPTADSVNGHLLSQAEKSQRQALIRKIRDEGYEQVMEEVAYTWFNRFAALRFMEVNGYLPSHVRVFTNDAGEFKPQILTEAIHMELEGIDLNRVYELEDANKSEELYKYLLIIQCNALNGILPGMFQRISDYTELLFPDNLLRKGSVIEQMVTMIPEEDWTDQVQIIGWLYQYYISAKKDKVFADLKKNIKISKENIPAATQLFTPDWIVHYMVENSLGRLWLEGHPNDSLKAEWKYYLDEAEQEPEVEAQLAEIRKEYADIKPEEIRVIDPCMGSGHILCVLFDVLVRIYEDYGYTAREAVRKIVEKNLYGLDIDERAAQLAYFSVMMKARQYDRRFFSKKDAFGNPDVPRPHVYPIIPSSRLDSAMVKAFMDDANELFQDERPIADNTRRLLEQMRDADEYGSIITVKDIDFSVLYGRYDLLVGGDQITMTAQKLEEQFLPFLRVAEMLSMQYDVVVTNPPYMGGRNMNEKLLERIVKEYPEGKADLFSAFILRNIIMTKQNGFNAMITMHSWMFLSSFEQLRGRLLDQCIVNMNHLGARAFEEISGEVVQTTTWTIRKSFIPEYIGSYVRLLEYGSQVEKEQRYKTKSAPLYRIKQTQFSSIPGNAFGYWLRNPKVFSDGELLESIANPRQGLKTLNNDYFIRFWYEINREKMALGICNSEEAQKSQKKWFPLNHGGEFRKYYGNNYTVVNWEDDGREMKENAINKYKCITRTITNIAYYFKEGITWSVLCTDPSFRWYGNGYIFSNGGQCIVPDGDVDLCYLIGLLNSKITGYLLNILSPTLGFESGYLKKLPILYTQNYFSAVKDISINSIDFSKEEWDSFEISWDFQQHPFIRWQSELWDSTTICATMFHFYGEHPQVSCPLELCYLLWQGECNERFIQLKANEEELNRIFIDIYGLQDELTPEVEDKDVTVRKAELGRDIRSFISYAVGCMFGRYSPDKPGLIFAGGDFDETFWQYKGHAALDKYGEPIEGGYAGISMAEYHYPALHDSPEYATATKLRFEPDPNNIIPITDDEYFEDDIVGYFVRFVKTVFGEDTLEANLQFIADALGGKGTARQVIRSYFLNDFYADHCKIYQKRPIYWLFDSGKKNGFKCLIYMHRYQPDTIARIRTDYVHGQQSRYRTAIADLEQRMNGAPTAERVKLSKQLAKIQDQAEELRIYEEKIHHLADQMISIDLDDGVKENYAKFQDVLAKIK